MRKCSFGQLEVPWHQALALQQATTRCSTLQHTATHCYYLHLSGWDLVLLSPCRNAQQLTVTQCNTQQLTVTHGSARQRIARHCDRIARHCDPSPRCGCSVMQQPSHQQRTATHCNTLQHTATRCDTLQHAATCYKARQNTATHCNTL